jgi:hypothetical protein
MSYPTTNAFIHYSKGWDSTTRSHPCMAWFEDYAKLFDTGEMFSVPYIEWHTDDYSYAKSTGEVIEGGAPAFEALKQTYSVFKGNNHEPRWLCCWETQEGWEMVGEAVLFGNLVAPGGSGQAHTDLAGKKWDVGVPSAFHFKYVKDTEAKHGGIRLKRSEIFSDSAPVVVEMLKRGMLKPEQLMG